MQRGDDEERKVAVRHTTIRVIGAIAGREGGGFRPSG